MYRLLPRRHSAEAPMLAATVLLRWLSLCVLTCLVGAAGFYLLAQLSEDASIHRREMNAAAYRTQLYFDQREGLLNYLVDSVVVSSPRATRVDGVDTADENVHRLALGTGKDGSELSLPLSGRTEHTLAAYGAELIHVRDDPLVPRQWLGGKQTPATPPPSELHAALLRTHAMRARAGTELFWLALDDSPSRIFLYRAIDDVEAPGQWLVLSLDAAAVVQTVNSKGIGDFVLVDSHGHRALSNHASAGPPTRWMQTHSEDQFAFVWSHAVPHGLALVKSVGEDGWRLVYHVPMSLMLGDIAVHLGISVLLCVAVLAALRVLMRRIDRQLIQPAHRQQSQMVESLNFCSTVFDLAPVGICVLRSADGAIMLENQLARDWLGANTAKDDWVASWRTALDRGASPAHPHRGMDFTTRSGKQLQVLYAPTRYLDADVLLCAFSDISHHRQIQAALSSAKQAADDASQAKSAFVATMSHEIRTPLYGVLGTLDLLGNTTLDARQARYLRTIRQSSSVLLKLISDILDVSKIESGRLNLAVAPFSPRELAESTVRAYAAAAAAKNLQILVSADPRLPSQVIGDADRVRQVLGNLVSNAIKFTDSGRVLLRVRCDTCDGGTTLVSWQVTDTGIGIEQAEQAQLFEPFKQVPVQGNLVGTGLGLSISDHLVRLMNGTLRVVSEKGLGSSFTMTLPLAVAESDDSAGDPHLAAAPPVYVRGPLLELNGNACQWLRRWGATARVYTAHGRPVEPGAILVDAGPQLLARTQWEGPRVVASEDADELPQFELGEPGCMTVSMFSIQGIGRAIEMLQRGTHVSSSPDADLAPKLLDLDVLVAEDNAINRVILKEQLESLGCRVMTATDGHEALALANSALFDVLLTDINMPGMGGHALVQALRAQGSTLRVIGATANATSEERARCLASGMDGYLVKPINFAALRNAISPLAQEAGHA